MVNTNLETFVLSPYVRVGFKEGELHLGFGSLGRIISDSVLQRAVLEAAATFKHPTSFSDARKQLLSQGLTSESIEEAFSILKDRFLLAERQYDESHRHSRSQLYYALSGSDGRVVQKRLEQAHVAIVGCGGIGNLVACLLATAGIGEMTLVDDDSVELSNLNRQILYTEADCAQRKVDSLKSALHQRASKLPIHTFSESINDSNLNLLDTASFIVLSGDSPGLVDTVNEYCVRRGTPFLNVGYVEDIAVWGPLVIPGFAGCTACRSHYVSNRSTDSRLSHLCKSINSGYQPPSNGPINMLASSLAALDILRVIGGFGTPESVNRRIGLWTDGLRFEHQDFSRNPDCPVCGKQ